jgi:hypothetical protein
VTNWLIGNPEREDCLQFGTWSAPILRLTLLVYITPKVKRPLTLSPFRVRTKSCWRSQKRIPCIPSVLSHYLKISREELLRHYWVTLMGSCNLTEKSFLTANTKRSMGIGVLFLSLQRQWRIVGDDSQHLWAFSSPISLVYFFLGGEIASDFSSRLCELISYACP